MRVMLSPFSIPKLTRWKQLEIFPYENPYRGATIAYKCLYIHYLVCILYNNISIGFYLYN